MYGLKLAVSYLWDIEHFVQWEKLTVRVSTDDTVIILAQVYMHRRGSELSDSEKRAFTI